MSKQWNKVTSVKVQRALNKVKMNDQEKASVLAALFPEKAAKKIRINRKVIQRIVKHLDLGGKCGLLLAKSGQIYVASAAHTKITSFNFQRLEVLQKALENKNKVS